MCVRMYSMNQPIELKLCTYTEMVTLQVLNKKIQTALAGLECSKFTRYWRCLSDQDIDTVHDRLERLQIALRTTLFSLKCLYLYRFLHMIATILVYPAPAPNVSKNQIRLKFMNFGWKKGCFLLKMLCLKHISLNFMNATNTTSVGNISFN